MLRKGCVLSPWAFATQLRQKAHNFGLVFCRQAEAEEEILVSFAKLFGGPFFDDHPSIPSKFSQTGQGGSNLDPFYRRFLCFGTQERLFVDARVFVTQIASLTPLSTHQSPTTSCGTATRYARVDRLSLCRGFYLVVSRD